MSRIIVLIWISGDKYDMVQVSHNSIVCILRSGMTYFDVFPVVLMGMLALNYVLPSCVIAKVAESKIQKCDLADIAL